MVITVDRSTVPDEPASRPRLSIVVVNYESWPDIVRLVDSLRDDPRLHSGDCEVAIVDNASTGPVPAAIDPVPPGFVLILRSDNGGFAAGVNAGWRASRGRWLLLLNPDVEIGPDFLGQILDHVDRQDDRAEGPAGIVGFGLLNPDGSPQGSVGVFPSLTRSIREAFIPRSRRKYRSTRSVRPGRVDWVTGACMLIHSRLMADLGGMDEDFFLYHEEVAFSREAHRRGWRVEFDPGLLVVHRHPLQNRAISPKMRVITRHSKLLYFRKHLPSWQFRALSAIVRMESVIRGRWASLRGRVVEARAWLVIGTLTKGMEAGRPVRGTEVLRLAESIGSGPGTSVAAVPHSRESGRRRANSGRSLRKDGPA